MIRRQFWQVSITTTLDVEDAVGDLLEHIFQEKASSYTKAATEQSTVTVYLERKPSNNTLELRNLRTALQQIYQERKKGAAPRINITKIAGEDWANSWKKHFKPIEVGGGLLIRPTWSKRRVAKGQALVQINPGLAFGTGQHPTTSFCLRELVKRHQPQKEQSFLDLGSGSGILAIAAAKLGYQPIDAIDLDREAITVSRANARLNRVERLIRFHELDLGKLSFRRSRRYDLICANLISTVLLSERQRIIAQLKPGGVVVLAGILAREFYQIKKQYEAAGLKLIASTTSREWRSGTFGFPQKLNKR